MRYCYKSAANLNPLIELTRQQKYAKVVRVRTLKSTISPLFDCFASFACMFWQIQKSPSACLPPLLKCSSLLFSNPLSKWHLWNLLQLSSYIVWKYVDCYELMYLSYHCLENRGLLQTYVSLKLLFGGMWIVANLCMLQALQIVDMEPKRDANNAWHTVLCQSGVETLPSPDVYTRLGIHRKLMFRFSNTFGSVITEVTTECGFGTIQYRGYVSFTFIDMI